MFQLSIDGENAHVDQEPHTGCQFGWEKLHVESIVTFRGTEQKKHPFPHKKTPKCIQIIWELNAQSQSQSIDKKGIIYRALINHKGFLYNTI
jgi:hypothetical protein